MSRGRHHLPCGGKHRTPKTRIKREELVKQATFGGFDGITSLAGVLAALLLAHAPSSTILSVTAGLAVAEGIGMAFGEYLSGDPPTSSAVLGSATLAGAFIPAIPVALFPGMFGLVVGLVLIVAFVVAIAELRGESRIRAYTLTIVTLLIASVAAVGAAVFLGAA